MKNQQVIILLILGLLFRNLFPFADLFVVTLVLLLIVFQDNVSIISLIATIVAFFYSLILDSPLGLFPLLLSLFLLIFSAFFPKTTGKGITPLLIWLIFLVTFILTETIVRLVLTTGTIALHQDIFQRIAGSSVIVVLFLFVLSFRRKL